MVEPVGQGLGALMKGFPIRFEPELGVLILGTLHIGYALLVIRLEKWILIELRSKVVN